MLLLSLFYLVYFLLIYTALAIIGILMSTLIFVLTYATLIVPSYFIFLIVVVRKQLVWSNNTTMDANAIQKNTDEETVHSSIQH